MALNARIVGYCNKRGPETIRLSVYLHEGKYLTERTTKQFLKSRGIATLYLVDHNGTLWEILNLIGLPAK